MLDRRFSRFPSAKFGDRLTTGSVNKIVQESKRLGLETHQGSYIVSALGLLTRRTIQRSSFEFGRFLVQSIGNEYLTCHTYDGTTEGSDDILVAKPPDFRASVMDGLSYESSDLTWVSSQTLTADDGVTEETWLITLSYFAGCEVYAVKNPDGGTGVDDVDWLDLNVAGRCWAVLVEA